MSTLEQRIAAIEDREAITDLILRHAEYIRSGAGHDAAELFFPDAVYEIAHVDANRQGEILINERIEGVAAIVGSKDVIAGEGLQLCPMIHNIRIDLDGDIATSTCVSMTTIWPLGNNFVGEYRDRFRREDGKWRFAARTFIGFGSIDGTYPDEAHARYQAAKTERAGA